MRAFLAVELAGACEDVAAQAESCGELVGGAAGAGRAQHEVGAVRCEVFREYGRQSVLLEHLAGA